MITRGSQPSLAISEASIWCYLPSIEIESLGVELWLSLSLNLTQREWWDLGLVFRISNSLFDCSFTMPISDSLTHPL